MNKGKISIFLSLLVASSFLGLNSAHGQYNLDYGGMVGASNYLGEIGGTKKPGKGTPAKPFVSDMRLDQTKFAIGGWIRYRVHPIILAKANLSFIRIGAVDSTSDYLNRRIRNLHFRNDIYELNLQAEYNFYSVHNISPKGRKVVDFAAYAFVGGGAFYNNPKAKYLGKWQALQPLGTEGQTVITGMKKYSRIQGHVSTGLGFYYTFGRKWRLGWEFGVRKTFTDYLDDVSTVYVDPTLLSASGTATAAMAADLSSNLTIPSEITDGRFDRAANPGAIRGNSERKDWYMYTALTMGYVVRGKNSFYKVKYQMRTGSKRKKRKTRAKF